MPGGHGRPNLTGDRASPGADLEHGLFRQTHEGPHWSQCMCKLQCTHADQRSHRRSSLAQGHRSQNGHLSVPVLRHLGRCWTASALAMSTGGVSKHCNVVLCTSKGGFDKPLSWLWKHGCWQFRGRMSRGRPSPLLVAPPSPEQRSCWQSRVEQTV